MSNTRINPMYHPLWMHFPVIDLDTRRSGKQIKKLTFCSRLCRYYCLVHDIVFDSKLKMQSHLRGSDDHSI